MKKIINGKIWQNDRFVEGQALYFEDTIKEATQEVTEVIDAEGAYVLPGFIDVHIHGYKGTDVMDGTEEGLRDIAKGICENGVTAFLPTTMTMAEADIRKALGTIRTVKSEGSDGAMVLGAHLEGPYINIAKKGAQPGEHVIPPDAAFLKAYEDIIKVVTIAPEVAGAMEVIKAFGDKMNFSLGHTAATYEQATEAYEAGAKSATHLMNAMTPLNHRAPGVVGAALRCDCYSEVIADNIHLHPSVYKIIEKAKGLDKLLLITDCMRAGGLADGDYTLGGQAVKVTSGKCTLEDGTIAGSVLTLNKGLKHFKEGLEKPLEEVLPLVTRNQAEYLKVSDKMGTLEAGKLANITVMNSDYTIKRTIVKGKTVYESHL